MRSEKVYAENFEQALRAAPDIGSIDFHYGIVATKNATRIGPNLWHVDIWHQGDDDNVETCLDDDDVHPFFAATVVSACLLLALAVIVALVNGVALLIELVFG
jgi:hypothetical protein